MTDLKLKFLGVVALLFTTAIALTAIRSHFQITRLERAVEQTKQFATEQQQRSDELEKQTHIYKEKAAYLETKLIEIETAAREQDEQLKKLSIDTDAARRDLQRYRERANRTN